MSNVYCKNCKFLMDIIRAKTWFECEKPVNVVGIPDYICTHKNNKTEFVKLKTWYAPELQAEFKDHPKQINWNNRCEWYEEKE